MRRHAPDRTRAVAEQHVIGDPDRNFLVGRRIDCISACECAGFFLGQLSSLQITLARSALSILAHGRPLLFGYD